MDGDGASEGRDDDRLGGDETSMDVGKTGDGDADWGGRDDSRLFDLLADASTATTAIATTTTTAARTSNQRRPGGRAPGVDAACKGALKVRRSPAVHVVAPGDRPSRDPLTHRRAVPKARSAADG